MGLAITFVRIEPVASAEGHLRLYCSCRFLVLGDLSALHLTRLVKS